MGKVNFNDKIGVFSENSLYRLDIGEAATQKRTASTHDSWATRLKIISLTGKTGYLDSEDTVGIYSEDGKYRLDIGTNAMKQITPANHSSWATNLIIRSLENTTNKYISYGDIVGIYSEDGKYRLDIGTDAVKQVTLASHDSWATRLKIQHNQIRTITTLGGGGGNVFASPGKVKSIAIRHGNKVDAIIINGSQFGGNGGDRTHTLTLAKDEYINKMVIRHGQKIDNLVIYTNKNRSIGGGGYGGRQTILSGRIDEISGRSGNTLDSLSILGFMAPVQNQNFGGNGGVHFAPLSIKSIAIRHGNKVDAIIINGIQFGGNGGDRTHTLTLGKDEYINKMVIRHGQKIDNLVIYTNKNRSIGGGGNGGTRTVLEGKVFQIGGRKGNTLDALQVISKILPDINDIEVTPSMDFINNTKFKNSYGEIKFNKNGFPLNYHSIAGIRTQHLQDMIRLPDANGRKYYMGTFSQNCSNDEGGMVFVGEVASGSSGSVIWMDEFNNSHIAGGYNHPGDLRRIGNIVVIAGQNWDMTPVPIPGQPFHRGTGNYQNILFYDVSKPSKPTYLGKLNSCVNGNKRETFQGDEIDNVFVVKLGDYYYLSFNGLMCRSKIFFPHSDWEFVKFGKVESNSPIKFYYNNKEYIGQASYSEDNKAVVYDELTYAQGDVPVKNIVKQPLNNVPHLNDGDTFSLSALPNGKSYIIFASVESDDYIKIYEIESMS